MNVAFLPKHKTSEHTHKNAHKNLPVLAMLLLLYTFITLLCQQEFIFIEFSKFCCFSVLAVTPRHGPQITGGQPRYQIGEIVRVNCTSAPSKPVCHLSWLINGMHANRSFLRPYEPLIVGREGLEVARLGLEFRVRG